MTSSLVPTPYRGDEDEDLVPDFVPSISWEILDLVSRGARPTAPPGLAGIFYEGKNHLLSGESESGKSWLALAVAVSELLEGRGVLWADADDVGEGDVLERLRALGCPDEAISERFAYICPDASLDDAIIGRLCGWVRERQVRLAVLDGFNPLLVLHGLSPDSGSDVEQLYRRLDPVRRLGCACVWTDNVVKNSETRGKWSIGSERKKSKAEGHLGARQVEIFGRGRTGKARLEIFKDRPGHLRASPPGLFVLESEGESCRWRFEADRSKGDAGEFRPTALMERVSRFLERRSDPQSRNTIETEVTGRGEYLRAAMDCLIAEGYAEEVDGPRGGRHVQLLRAFSEEADEHEAA